MFYTPKHCIECGEKIDRNEWKITTSRRFCENCEGEYKIADWLPRMFFAISLLLALIGIGSSLKRSEQSSNVLTAQLVSSVPNKSPGSEDAAKQTVQNPMPNRTTVEATDTELLKRQSPILAVNQNPAQAKTNLSGQSRQNQAVETVYYCGAQTKKGTPCSRRVKVKGERCWQHRGLPAMLPPEQLVANH